LLNFPAGTLIKAYILVLLHSKKGKIVFSPKYANVRAMTLQVKQKSSIIVLVALGLLVMVIVAAVVVQLGP
jgi:hypothetical protein